MRSFGGDDGIDLVARVGEGWRRTATVAILHALRVLEGIDVEAVRVEHGAHRGVEGRVRVGRIRIDAIAILRPGVHGVRLRIAHLEVRRVSMIMAESTAREGTSAAPADATAYR